MAENDILWFFFKLHPLVVALTVWFLGFGSLLLVAIKTKSLKENIIKSPGVIIGDFFLLPFAGFLISQSYQNVVSSTMLVSSSNWNFLLIISVTLALISTIRFNHKSIWWLPHNVFYFLMSYIVLVFVLKGLVQLGRGENNNFLATYTLVLVAVSIHQLLGIFFPKRFPNIK